MSILGYLNIAMPVVLTLMGLLASWVSQAEWQRIGWSVAFAIAGVLAIYAGIRDRQTLSAESLGGDQFCAVSFLYGPGMNPSGQFSLAITNPGNLPLYDVLIEITRRGDFFQNGTSITVNTLYPREILRRLNFSLPIGDYVISIRTKAGAWFFERLTLTETNGDFHQAYYVRRIGDEKRLMDAR